MEFRCKERLPHRRQARRPAPTAHRSSNRQLPLHTRCAAADAASQELDASQEPKMIKNGLHDVFAPGKLVKFWGKSKFPSQQQEEEETAIVDGRTEYVVQRI